MPSLHISPSVAQTSHPVPLPIAPVPSGHHHLVGQPQPPLHQLPLGDRDLHPTGKPRGRPLVSLPSPLRNQILSGKRPKSTSTSDIRKRDENNNKKYTTSTSTSRKKEEDILPTHSNPHHHHTNNNNNTHNNNILTTATSSATNNQQPPYLPQQLAGEASDSNRNNNSVSPPGQTVNLSSEAFPTPTTETTNPNNPGTTITTSTMGGSTAVHLSGVPLDPTKIVRSDFERVPYLTTAKKRKSLRNPAPMLAGKRSLRTSPVEQPPMSQPAQEPAQVVAPRRGPRGSADNDAKTTSVIGRRTRHTSQNNASSSPSSNSNGSGPAVGATDVGRKRRHEVAISQSASASDSEGVGADARKKKRRTNNTKLTASVKSKSPTIVEQLKSRQLAKNKAATTEPEIDISKAGLLKLAPIARERNVFWVKIKGHPYWPAQLVDLDAELEGEPRFQKAQRFSRKGETTCVMYFGTCEVAFVNRERSCIAWDDALTRGIVEVEDRIKVGFKVALLEVAAFCTPTPRFPRGWWNEPDVLKLAANFYERNTESSGQVALSRNKKEYACADSERVMWAKFRGPSYWPVQIIPRNVAAEHRPDLNMDIMDVSQPAVQARKIRAGMGTSSGDRLKGAKAGGNSGDAESSSSSSSSDFGGPSMYLPCMFFGTGEVELIAEKNLVPYRAGITRGYLGHNDRHEFLIAIGEAWGYLQEPRIWPSGYISRKTWWNHKSATSTERRKKRDFNSKRDGSPESGQRITYSSSSSLDSAVPDLSLLPHYDHIKKSVWVVEPMPRVKKADITCCECKLDNVAGHNSHDHHHGGRKDRNNKDGKDIPLTPCCYDASCLNFASNFLCAGSCPAGKACRNVSFHRRRSPKMTPFFTPDQRGWGIRVDEPVRRGSFVIEYVGEIIDRDILDARLKRMDRENSTEYYMMELTNDLLVDAKFKGNLSRFINSSCDPNCQTQKWTDPVTGQTHVGIFAIQDIVPGTELTYNYCFEDFGLAGKRGKRSFQCMCGTASCMMLEQVERDMLKRLIGQRVEVRWDDGWYPGVVQQYYPQRKRFRVQYDDGDCEDLVLGMPLADKDDEVMYRVVEDDGDSSMGGREESQQQKNTGAGNGPGRRKKNAGSNPSSQDGGSYSHNSDVAAGSGSGGGKNKAGGTKGDTLTKGRDGESKKKSKK